MAKICGIELKSVKIFGSQDGQGVNGNIYMDGRQVGRIFDGGYGGGLEVRILGKEAREDSETRCKAYFTNAKDKKGEYFDATMQAMEELLSLLETEKFIKKMSKKGFPVVLRLFWANRLWQEIDERDFRDYKAPEMAALSSVDSIEKCIGEKKPKSYDVFTKLEDFIRDEVPQGA